jgi:outer membrane receptor protein involved in Fe transport
VRTKGAEVGARFATQPSWSLSAVAWGLDIASEFVFVGDAGVTAPSRPSRRVGIELSGGWRPVGGVHLDADLAYAWARFRDRDPAGDHIPGAVEGVASSGIAFEHPSGGFADLRLRYFGSRPLIEDNSVRSNTSAVLNGQLGYRAHRAWTLTLQVFNLLDAKASDVDYFYTSRLPGERPQGVDDVHSHPQEPLSVRLVLSTGSPR